MFTKFDPDPHIVQNIWIFFSSWISYENSVLIASSFSQDNYWIA